MKKLFSGNEACAEAALLAGVRFFAGYPITPSTEIAEYMASNMPKRGGKFIQMEDELASIISIIGASAAGVKSMTATSGPGFSLMQEGIGYAAMTETPTLIVNVMRGGPSTGLPTKGTQQDVMQTKWGSHGDRPSITLSAENVKEAFSLTVRSIDIAERLRLPVILLLDEFIAHMREVIDIPERVTVYSRQKPDEDPQEYVHYDDKRNYNAPYAWFGLGYKIHLTGLTHRKDGFPTNKEEEIRWKMKRLRKKIDDNLSFLEDIEIIHPERDNIIITFGSGSRPSKELVEGDEQSKFGLIRLRTIWPFPYNTLETLLKGKKLVVVVEMNEGQIEGEVKKITSDKTSILGIHRVDGELISPDEIREAL